jgi:glyoxylate reductase
MNTNSVTKVTVAKTLLPAGMNVLEGEFEVTEGGPDCDREHLLEMVAGSAALIADPTVVVDGEVLDAAGSELKVVANYAVGYDNIDLGACASRGVIVTNTPDVLTDATAELAVGLTFAAARRIPEFEGELRAGRWIGWDPGGYRGIELTGCTIGVLGMGRIGRRYAEIMSGVAGQILFWSRSALPAVEQELGVRQVGLHDLLAESDVVSIHVAASPENEGMIGSGEIAAMKPGSILVNTARGSLVVADAVAEALASGQLGGAGLDVFENEPEVPRVLLDAPGAVLTPHIGSATFRARDEMARLAARNVREVLSGRDPVTPVG